MRKLILSALALACAVTLPARRYWKINPEENRITWTVRPGDAHRDHIEMAGKRVAVVLRYGVNAAGGFELNKSLVWPMLRTIPNQTYSSLMRRFGWDPLDAVTIDGASVSEQVQSIALNGTLEVTSLVRTPGGRSLSLKRVYFPSTDRPALIELYEFANTGSQPVSLEIPSAAVSVATDPDKGVDGSYRLELQAPEAAAVTLQPGCAYRFAASVAGYKPAEKAERIDGWEERTKRLALTAEWTGRLVLETPDTVLNRMFAFSKIRALESIYETKGGPMHGPGGEAYYAAIWANDQAEYIDPYFPYTGYAYGNASAMNSFAHFARYMNDEWRPVPSSIIAEGDGYWNGAGDRGDAAMIAYGAARYALASGNRAEAEQLWPFIEWCLEYCRRKLNAGGVVASDSDELEGRFPAGEANLCTSSLYYDALLSAAYLGADLGKPAATATRYRRQAGALRKSIDAYFAAQVEGFDTYAYYKGNDVLRAWICIPLTVGLGERAKGTVDALFSPRLWSENGLLTQAGSKTFWDRSTLYALRGVFMAGETERALTFLQHYSATRLLGEHVPYAVEAWPEGNQRHLSAESALYGRIFTEGLFGIRPTGLHSFTLTPRLPAEWNEMALRRIGAFGSEFDIRVVRLNSGKLEVRVEKAGKTVLNKKIEAGSSVSCKLL